MFDNIDKAQKALDSDELGYHTLKPLHSQLLSGKVKAPSATRWTDDFPSDVARDLLAADQSDAFWVAFGLQTAAVIALIVSELATRAMGYVPGGLWTRPHRFHGSVSSG